MLPNDIIAIMKLNKFNVLSTLSSNNFYQTLIVENLDTLKKYRVDFILINNDVKNTIWHEMTFIETPKFMPI